MRDLATDGLAENTNPGVCLAGAFTLAELGAIRIGELDLRAIRTRRQSLFTILRQDSTARLANHRLEALRALIVATGADSTSETLPEAHRAAIELGLDEAKLRMLIDRYRG
jgi:hypothetical protein